MIQKALILRAFSVIYKFCINCDKSDRHAIWNVLVYIITTQYINKHIVPQYRLR